MARKIFVTYKYGDSNVEPLGTGSTARAYVDKIIELFEGEEIYKGEEEEDLSNFKDETIKSALRDKIYDSTITIVLISPQMKEAGKEESDQWIPWEVSYSLKEITRDGRTSQTNAILAVVLPDAGSSYSYFLEEKYCAYCEEKYRSLDTEPLFEILKSNMFNIKEPMAFPCKNPSNNDVLYPRISSYVYSVKWEDFVDDIEGSLKAAETRRDEIDKYEIVKEV